MPRTLGTHAGCTNDMPALRPRLLSESVIRGLGVTVFITLELIEVNDTRSGLIFAKAAAGSSAIRILFEIAILPAANAWRP